MPSAKESYIPFEVVLIEMEHLTSDHVAKASHHELAANLPSHQAGRPSSDLCVTEVVHLGLRMSKARGQCQLHW